MHKFILGALLALSVAGCSTMGTPYAANDAQGPVLCSPAGETAIMDSCAVAKMNNTESAIDAVRYPEGLGQK